MQENNENHPRRNEIASESHAPLQEHQVVLQIFAIEKALQICLCILERDESGIRNALVTIHVGRTRLIYHRAQCRQQQEDADYSLGSDLRIQLLPFLSIF